MFEDKFPPHFDNDGKSLDIEPDLCTRIPSYDEMCHIVNYIISIREKYCPPSNYDVSARSSRGIFLGIPDSGIEALSILSNNGICEVFMCAYSPDRRSRIFRNCMVLGIENQVKVCGYSFCDAIDQWYPYYSVMTPVFLDLSGSVKALNVSVQDGTSVSIDGRDLGEVLQQCWKQHVPFVCIRISKSNVDVLRSYEAGLRVFQEDTSFSASVSYVALVPPLQKLDQGSLVYPGDDQLPTILSQSQFKAIWTRGGDLKSRTEQWIRKVIHPSAKAEESLALIRTMVSSDNPNDQQDFSIYTALYHLLFPESEKEAAAVPDAEPAEAPNSEATPTPIVSCKEESCEVALDVQPSADSGNSQAAQRAKSRVTDFRILLPKEVCSHRIQSYCDVGCADGSITVAIGEYLQLSPTQIFGCDVRDLSEETSRFQFRYYDGRRLPYVNNSFDLLTVYMVMHHIPKIEVFLAELYRVLKVGGYLIIREHDCEPNDMRLFLDVEHGLYALVLSPAIETPDFCTTFQTYYHSRQQWRKMLCDVGFREITTEDVSQEHRRDFSRLTEGVMGLKRGDGSIRNPLNSYYGVFTKSDGKKAWEHNRDQKWGRDREREYSNQRDRDRRYRDRGDDYRRDRDRRDNDSWRDRDRYADRRDRDRSYNDRRDYDYRRDRSRNNRSF